MDFLEIYTGFHKIPQDPGNPVGPKWPNINVSRTRRKSPFPQDIRKIPQDSTRFTKIPQDRNICERWLERWPYIFDETFFLQAEKLFSKQKLKYLNKVYFYLYTLLEAVFYWKVLKFFSSFYCRLLSSQHNIKKKAHRRCQLNCQPLLPNKKRVRTQWKYDIVSTTRTTLHFSMHDRMICIDYSRTKLPERFCPISQFVFVRLALVLSTVTYNTWPKTSPRTWPNRTMFLCCRLSQTFCSPPGAKQAHIFPDKCQVLLFWLDRTCWRDGV